MTDTHKYSQLMDENILLREQLRTLKKDMREDLTPTGKEKPIQGMITLLQNKNKQIEESMQQLQETNNKLHESYKQTITYYRNTILALASALEAKEPFFQFHSSNVEHIARQIGQQLSLSKKEITTLSTAALIHDFGNIGVNSAVLLKKEPLTPQEREHINTHTLVASIILEPIGDFAEIIPAIKHHHERFDGKGYPSGLSGTDIPLFSRILFVAESYIGMTSSRPYREAFSQEEVSQYIYDNSGIAYDPDIVTAFKHIKR